MEYQYVICCVDDVCFISDDPILNMKVIQDKFKLKGYKIEEPDMYIVADLSNMTDFDGQDCWDIYFDKYCTAAVTNVGYVLEKLGLRLPLKCFTPMSCGYCPYMDVTGDIKSNGVQL